MPVREKDPVEGRKKVGDGLRHIAYAYARKAWDTGEPCAVTTGDMGITIHPSIGAISGFLQAFVRESPQVSPGCQAAHMKLPGY